jgi:hypothetical protein
MRCFRLQAAEHDPLNGGIKSRDVAGRTTRRRLFLQPRDLRRARSLERPFPREQLVQQQA